MLNFGEIFNKLKLPQWALITSVLTILLYQLSFPPFHIPEAAYFFAVPFLLGSAISENKKNLKTVAFGSAWIAWFILLIWLRHVTWIGLVVLSGILGTFLGGWLIVAQKVLLNIQKKTLIPRLTALIALASLWVTIEWLKTFLFSGFPWLPLAASQWERPVLLQILPWTGSYGLSFIIIFINLAITQYGLHLRNRIKAGKKPGRSACPELHIAIAMLLGLIFLFTKSIPKKDNQEAIFTVGVAQPYTPALLKWDKTFFEQNLLTLQNQTLELKKLNPDLILWPETAIPTALNNGRSSQQWAEALATDTAVTILAGGLMLSDENFYTALIEIRPEEGVISPYYAKRKLVPFGEYVPLRQFFPFIEKIVPSTFDVLHGDNPNPLLINLKNKNWEIGGLICYEDIFPDLARQTTLLGAELFVVATNNAWYGEEAGAYQHAAHSILRAVEMRRPFVRCGNGGWSGWINEYGSIKGVVINETDSVYFQGVKIFSISRDRTWKNRLTFYAKHGDWFPRLCASFSILALFFTRKNKK